MSAGNWQARNLVVGWSARRLDWVPEQLAPVLKVWPVRCQLPYIYIIYLYDIVSTVRDFKIKGRNHLRKL